MSEQCFDCRYFRPAELTAEQIEKLPLDVLRMEKSKGTCRRYPPTLTHVVVGIQQGLFASKDAQMGMPVIQNYSTPPVVWGNGWCGEWKNGIPSGGTPAIEKPATNAVT